MTDRDKKHPITSPLPRDAEGNLILSPRAVVLTKQPKTEYNIRLVSGRIVEPGPGGFYWFHASGRTLGSALGIDWVMREFAAGALGAVGVADRFGAQETITEFIPQHSIESIVRRAP